MQTTVRHKSDESDDEMTTRLVFTTTRVTQHLLIKVPENTCVTLEWAWSHTFHTLLYTHFKLQIKCFIKKIIKSFIQFV